jgi:hypothetical protein
MIISSTADSLANGIDIAATLPEPNINLEPQKIIASSRTIGGGATISVWEAEIAGTMVEPEFVVNIAQLAKLRAIKASGVDEWLVRTQGKIYNAMVDLGSVIRETRRQDHFRVQLRIVIVSEETDTG